jgi:hypothetical protein
MSVVYSEPYKYESGPVSHKKTSLPVSGWNSRLLDELNIKTNWEYRQYMTQKSADVMKYNSSNAYDAFGYSRPSQNLMFSKSTEKPSDLKESYLNKYELESRMIAPELTAEDVRKIRYKS